MNEETIVDREFVAITTAPADTVSAPAATLGRLPPSTLSTCVPGEQPATGALDGAPALPGT
jgi:hypothetical protein